MKEILELSLLMLSIFGFLFIATSGVIVFKIIIEWLNEREMKKWKDQHNSKGEE